MRFDREAKRTAAQFLNGLAVATIASGVLVPLATGEMHAYVLLGATLAAAALHGAALALAMLR